MTRTEHGVKSDQAKFSILTLQTVISDSESAIKLVEFTGNDIPGDTDL